ncbi:MAG: hypothetical protein U5O16_25255 [Rhodococcus sp. (in: high G+C Gram-positive bacteria)]|uniref:hypothetical protein n=1 Tax=Rhodococcus sp. TaxID=1831 RepID=UPI002AD8089F|nr:hypothetical protein [Rhodococcus sp. (in: high G+C Gram-positive bacteria)]
MIPSLRCSASPTSPHNRGLADNNISYLVGVNKAEAGRTLQDWRESDRPELITENTTHTAAARTEYRDAVRFMHYVNTIHGLNIDISAGSLPTAQAPTTFLHRADLMN